MTFYTQAIQFTDAAVAKIKQICDQQNSINGAPALRLGVLGGGCSGFRYAMQFEFNGRKETDDAFLFDNGAKVYVDQMSMMYLDGCTVDYETGITQSGFIFKNPQVKSTCGCGQSFSA